MKPKLGILQQHPPPYRSATLTKVHERGLVDIHALTMFEVDFGHQYRPKTVLGYPNKFLGRGFTFKHFSHFNPELLRELYVNKFDVICVPGWFSINAQLSILYALLTRTPLIFSSDTVLFPDLQGNYPSKSRLWLFRQLIEHSDALWVPGKASQEFMEKCGSPREKIFQGAYCLDLDSIISVFNAARRRRKEIRNRLNITDTDWLFLFVGRMLPFRGLSHLLDAFAELSRLYPEVKLLLIGDGIERSGLETRRDKLGLTGMIFLDPMPQDALTEYYAASDAYIMPALRENYSLALAQAAICGLPMISTDRVGAVKDYVVQGHTGYIIPAGDSHAMSAAMMRLATSRDQAQAMGKNAATIAGQRTIAWAAEQLEAAVFKALDLS